MDRVCGVSIAWVVALGCGLASAQAPIGLFDEPVAPIVGGQTSTAAPTIGLGDVTGDGQADLVAGSAPFLWGGDGHGRLAVVPGASLGAGDLLGAGPASRVLADFNGDGRIDLAVNVGFQLHVRLSVGGTGMTLQPTLGVSPGVLAGGDGDGDVDLILSSPPLVNQGGSTPQPARLYRNNGAGVFTFSPGSGLPTGSGKQLALADMDGDGDLDLVITRTNGVGFALNNGAGVFTTLSDFTSLTTSSIRVVHLNADALPDVLIGPPALQVAWTAFFGGPGASMTLGWSYSAPAIVNDVLTVDLNNDGVNELLVAGNQSLDLLSVLGGAPVLQASFPMRAVAAYAADLDGDGDGDQDVVVEARPPLRSIKPPPPRSATSAPS